MLPLHTSLFKPLYHPNPLDNTPIPFNQDYSPTIALLVCCSSPRPKMQGSKVMMPQTQEKITETSNFQLLHITTSSWQGTFGHNLLPVLHSNRQIKFNKTCRPNDPLPFLHRDLRLKPLGSHKEAPKSIGRHWTKTQITASDLHFTCLTKAVWTPFSPYSKQGQLKHS